MDPYSTANAASHEIVWAIIRIPTPPDSHDMSRTLRALRTSDRLRARVGYGALSIVMLAIAALAKPAE